MIKEYNIDVKKPYRFDRDGIKFYELGTDKEMYVRGTIEVELVDKKKEGE